VVERQAVRRPVSKSLANLEEHLRCPYCGNENPGDHRFCGMCGRPLVETRAEPTTTPVAREPEPPTPAPAYTGGIFNLGAPSDKGRDLDYLLEDDEEHKSNTGLIFLTIVALGLVVGLGWLRWRNGSFPSLKSLTSSSQPKPAAPTDSSAQPPTGSEQPNPAPGSTAQPPAPATDVATQPSVAPANPQATETTIPPAISNASPTPTATATPDATAAAASAPPPTHDSTSEEIPDKSPAPAAEAATPPPAPAKPKPAAKAAPKPASKVTDPVVIGEHYLYGSQGFPQNCERGLRYVKPAADQSNPKAMITMGALYATGHCLSRDLPTAYRFFALALRGDPENVALRQNTERVWKQMTAEERKQAIRMTQ
jgi:hypothetical protein